MSGRNLFDPFLQFTAQRDTHDLRLGLFCGALAFAAAMVGCVSSFDPGPVGLTAGGPQDMAAARSAIESGWLPEERLITVEGFLSEHDVPLTPPAGAEEIYASFGLAWRKPFLEPAPMAEVYLRLGTTINLADYARRPQNLVLVVDRSGSMRDHASYADGLDKMSAVRQALHSLLDQLTAEDRVSLISFSHIVTTDVKTRPGTDRNAIKAAIDRLQASGNTDLFSALRLGFAEAAASSDPARDNRVILFSDALPTTGTKQEREFVALAEEYAQWGVGLTLMSVGTWFGDALVDQLGRVPLANAYYLDNAERIVSVFDEEFDFFVTPAAHDLRLTITIPDEIGVREVYGVADYTPGARGAEVSIPTLFFSRREGGGPIIVRLTFAEPPDFTAPVALGHVALRYTPAGGLPRSSELALTLPAGLEPSGAPAWYGDEAVRRTALLLDTVLVVREASEAVRLGRWETAATLVDEFLTEFDQRALGLSDRTDPTARGLSDERDLLEAVGAIVGRR